jgi:ribosomal protein S27AE
VKKLKHKPVLRNKFYKIKDGKIEIVGRVCKRCGNTFMAAHKQPDGKIRYYCGKCHLTIWE